MIKILTLVILIMMGSCKKDELITNNIFIEQKVTEVKKYGKIHPKKRKFRIFRKKKYKVAKSF